MKPEFKTDEEIMIPAWVGDKLAPVEKLQAHKLGLRHKAISVFVLRNDREVLMQRRALEKYHTPGLWTNTCCTHPHWDEPSAQCATRRLKEEMGITGLNLVRRGQVEYRAEVGNGLIEHEVVDLFVANADDTLKLELNPDEVMATNWVDYYELRAKVARNPHDYTPWLEIYLEKYADKIFAGLIRV